MLSLIDNFRKSAVSIKEETVPVVIPRTPLVLMSVPPPLPVPPQATNLHGNHKHWSVDTHARLKIFGVESTGEFNTFLSEIGEEYLLLQQRIRLSRRAVCIRSLRIEAVTATFLWNTSALRIQELIHATETDGAIRVQAFQLVGEALPLEIVKATEEHPFFEFEIVEDEKGSRCVRSQPDPFTPQDDILF